MKDPDYAAFTARLIPDIAPETVLGVRIPALRSLARELRGTQEARAFLEALPHAYHEENHLHAFLLEQTRDYPGCLAGVERFLPYVGNWAVCDCLNPPVFKKHRQELLESIRVWLSAPHPYTVRFAIKMLMTHFLEADFDPSYLHMVCIIDRKEYYVNMMRAWYFATALAKQYEFTLPYLEQGRLDLWTHNRTIQKAAESFRITPEQKAYLKTLKRS